MEKNNTGVIFKNKNKKDKQPDYQGNVTIDGIDKNIALWVRDAKNGEKFFSVKISEKYKKETQITQKDDGLGW